MAGVFDLTKTLAFIEKQRPAAVVIVDTNVVMEEPDFTKWETPLEHPVFILSDVVVLELERVKKKPDSREKAVEAIRCIHGLHKLGDISEGIELKGLGWVMSVPSPREGPMHEELAQLDSLVQVFHQSDVKLLVLSRELSQSTPNIPVILATRDKSLFNIMAMNGMPAYPFEVFPMSGLDALVSRLQAKAPDVDWDEVLNEIQQTAEEQSIELELALSVKRRMPKGLLPLDKEQEDPLLMAEGFGSLCQQGMGQVGFTWSLLYREWGLWVLESVDNTPDSENESQSSSPESSDADLPRVQVDFGLSEELVSPQLRAAIAGKIAEFASPFSTVDEMPTVQGPKSVMATRIFLESLVEQAESEGVSESTLGITLSAIQHAAGDEEDFINLCTFWFIEREAEEDDRVAGLGLFLEAITSCWNPGETVRVRLIPGSE